MTADYHKEESIMISILNEVPFTLDRYFFLLKYTLSHILKCNVSGVLKKDVDFIFLF